MKFWQLQLIEFAISVVVCWLTMLIIPPVLGFGEGPDWSLIFLISVVVTLIPKTEGTTLYFERSNEEQIVDFLESNGFHYSEQRFGKRYWVRHKRRLRHQIISLKTEHSFLVVSAPKEYVAELEQLQRKSPSG